MGRISFYDMRAQKYLEWTRLEKQIVPKQSAIYPQHRIMSVDPSSSITRLSYLKNGRGWLSRDSDFETFFQGADINNAIYTLAYETEGSAWGHCKYNLDWKVRASANKLFVAGGPLQLSICGSYAAIWDV